MSIGKDDPMTAATDALLLRRFRDEGDEASFEALFRRHYDMVYGVLYRLTGTRQEAEDLVQEVFLKLYRRPLNRGDNVAGWLYRVATNTGYNALRSANRRTRREQAAVAESHLADQHVAAPAEDEAARRDAETRVRRALARIKPRSAKLLVLRETGFSYAEMAEIVGVAAGSVGTLLARASDEFARAYEEEDGV